MTLSTGKIIGVVVITCALLLVLIVLVWYKLIKKRNESIPLPQKVTPLDKSKDDQKLTFHQINVNRAQHFRERASAAEAEARSDPNRRRSSFQAVFF
mmetsp:Transcript_18730/g.19489  ORF Transcript_18730/g.19489 Transcript_18730/m.19489 type:complete len:97 (+) Transcript_18730:37-327(+)